MISIHFVKKCAPLLDAHAVPSSIHAVSIHAFAGGKSADEQTCFTCHFHTGETPFQVFPREPMSFLLILLKVYDHYYFNPVSFPCQEFSQAAINFIGVIGKIESN